MKKALMLLGGQYHPFRVCGEVLREHLRQREIEVELTEDRGALRNLEGYDLVIVYAEVGKLTPQQEKGLCRFVESGGGFVGIHCASVAEGEQYAELLGSRFAGHGPVTQIQVRLVGDHEVTRRVKDFWVADEFYFLEPKADFQTVAEGTWHFQSHPLAYVRQYGKGRVFYIALGHDEGVFRNPWFRKLVWRGVRWAAGEEEKGPVRVGIVGYGGAFNMGKYHADIVKRTPGLEVAAVCDLDQERLKVAKEEQPGAKLYKDVRDMARDDKVDLGVVVTPHNTHAEVALALIEGGKHVICEKPFTVTVQEATQVIEAARKQGVMASVFHNRRWDGDFLTIKEIIADGLIGEVFHVEGYGGGYSHPRHWWRSHKPISGGAIYDWGAHFVDWILNIMPGKMESVYGFVQKLVWHDVTNEDHIQAIIRFEGGRYAEYQQSSIAAVGKPKWRILGTLGGILIEPRAEAAKVVSFARGYKEELEVPFMESDWDAYYTNIADHLLSGEPLAVTPESARRVIAVLELCEKAARTGQPQPVPYEDEKW